MNPFKALIAAREAQAPASGNPLQALITAREAQPKPMGEVWTEAGENFVPSMAKAGKGLVRPFTDPAENILGVQHLIKGVIDPLIPGEQGGEGNLESIKQAFSDRYGGWENIKQSVADDPFGVLMDALSVGSLGIGAVGKAASVAKRVPSKKDFIEGAPTTAQLKGEGSRAYGAAKAEGAFIPAKSYDGFTAKLTRKMQEAGLDTVLHGKAARAFKLSRQAGGNNVNLLHMQNMRRHFGVAGRSPEPDERRIASIAIDEIDDFMESAASGAAAELGKGRKLWAKMRKSDLIEETIEKASTRAAGVEAGTRNEFSKLYRNKKKMRGFNASEMAAIKAIFEGGSNKPQKMAQNLLRRIGSVGGGSGQQRNVLNLMAGGGLGAAAGASAGGPVGAAIGGAVVPAIGYGAARLAERGTKGRADMARAVVARGQTPKTAPVPRPAVNAFGRGMMDFSQTQIPQAMALAYQLSQATDPNITGVR